MGAVVVYKQPYEEFSFAVSWAGKLASGVAISTATLSAVDKDGNDATGIILASTTGVIVGETVVIKTIGGVDKMEYKVTTKLVLSNTEKLEDDTWVYVREK